MADLARGTGASRIAMAQGYPLISVDGFDLDADAIQAARRNADEADVADRVTFTAADASGPGVSGQYDLVTIIEGLHDMSRPVDALRVARGMLREPGCAASPMSWSRTSSPPPPPSKSNITTAGAWSHACRRSWATRIPSRPEP